VQIEGRFVASTLTGFSAISVEKPQPNIFIKRYQTHCAQS